MADNIINHINLSDNNKADLNAKYWCGHEPSEIAEILAQNVKFATINEQSIFGGENIVIDTTTINNVEITEQYKNEIIVSVNGTPSNSFTVPFATTAGSSTNADFATTAGSANKYEGELSLEYNSGKLTVSLGDNSKDVEIPINSESSTIEIKEDNISVDNLPILFKGSDGSINYNNGFNFNPSQKYIYASGFFETSDCSLKDIVNPIGVDLDKLSKLRKVYFTWKENQDSDLQIGMIAQDVKELYPELVSENNGTLSLAYDKLSVVTLEAIDVLHRENNELKTRIEKLEYLVNQLVKNN